MNRNILIFLLSLTTLLLMGFTGYLLFKSPGIVYVDLPYVFERFEYTKELKKDAENVIKARKAILDSLRGEIYIAENNGTNSSDINAKVEQFMKFEEEFKTLNAELTSKYDQQIYTRINEYMSDFGAEHDYDLVLGSNGDGGIMFADTTLNVSSPFLQFINERYSGK